MRNAARGLLAAAIVVAAGTAALYLFGLATREPCARASPSLIALYLALAGTAPMSALALFRADGSPFPAQGFAGR